MRSGAAILAILFVGGCGGPPPDEAHRIAGDGPHAGLQCASCHQPPEGGGDHLGGFTSCEDCHAPGDLAPRVELAGVAFDHAGHGAGPGRLEAQCAACHSHASGEGDLAPESGSCFLCHASLPVTAAGVSAGSCLECHGASERVTFAPTGLAIDHARIVERGVSCIQCHYDLLDGSGGVAESTCRECHAPGGVPTSPSRDDPGALHRVHSSPDGAVACTRCHEPVRHRRGALASAIALDCRGCHEPGDPALASPVDSTVHLAAQQLYTGLVPGHPEVLPAVKFTGRVACAGCHRGSGGTKTAADELRAIQAECATCHGPRFPLLLEGWVTAMDRRTEEVGRYLDRAAAGRAVRTSARADSILAEARELWRVVRDGRGVHNLPASHSLLREALDRAAHAWEEAGVTAPAPPALGVDPAANGCARCHYGIELASGRVRGETFRHEAHVTRAGLACEACHSSAGLFADDGRAFRSEHGATRSSAADCASCHHRGATASSSCAACHGGAFRTSARPVTVAIAVGEGPARTRSVAFDHASHSGLECTACHADPVFRRVGADVVSCTACHDDHHAADRDCARCHFGPGIREAHASAGSREWAHGSCDECHARRTIARLVPDRGLCVACHRAQASAHHEGSGHECSECHFLDEPGGLRSTLLVGQR